MRQVRPLMETTENQEKSNTKPGTVSSANDDDTKAKLNELQAKLEKLQHMLDGLEEEVKERALEDAGCGPASIDAVCNSCLVRKKGAALVPCGHTFCWKCTSDLRRGKGPCPSCNDTFWNALSISEVPRIA